MHQSEAWNILLYCLNVNRVAIACLLSNLARVILALSRVENLSSNAEARRLLHTVVESLKRRCLHALTLPHARMHTCILTLVLVCRSFRTRATMAIHCDRPGVSEYLAPNMPLADLPGCVVVDLF